MQNLVNRRKWLATSGLAALSACIRSKGTGFYGYALVANAGDNSLAAVDLLAFRLVSTIGLNAAPTRLVSVESLKTVYALTPSCGTIHAVDRELKVTKSRRLTGELSALGVASGERSLLALSKSDNEMLEVRADTLAVVGRHKFSISADAVDFATNGYVAAACETGGLEVMEIATGKRTRVDTPPLGQVRFRSDGKIVLAADVQNKALLALDVPTLRTVAELPLAMRPEYLCFNSDQGQLFVTGQGMDGVAVVFPFNMLQVDQTLLVGRNPGAMACSATPAYLFVASRTGSSICVLDIETRKVIGFVEVGGRPSFMTVTPDNQYALTLDRDEGTMAVLRIPSRTTAFQEIRLKSGTSLFTMIGVGSKPVDAVVVGRG